MPIIEEQSDHFWDYNAFDDIECPLIEAGGTITVTGSYTIDGVTKFTETTQGKLPPEDVE